MANIHLRILSLLILFVAALTPNTAQVTIWSEDFSGYPNGTTDAPGLWTSNGTDCDDPALNNGNQFGVYNGEFVINDVEGAPCCNIVGGANDNPFETVAIDISAYCEVSFSLSTSSSTGLECLNPGSPLFACTGNTQTDDFHDQMIVEYVLDGVTTQVEYFCGNIVGGFVSVTGLQGNSLVIRVNAANKFDAEYYYFDDILVEGIPPEEPPLSLAQTTFCQTGDPYSLNTIQGGVNGSWSGPGVVNNAFNPTLAGAGTHTLTFTPNAGECALPATIDVTVTPAPMALPASDETCANSSGTGVFDLTTLDIIVNGGTGNAVSWFLDPNANNPINNPSNYTTPQNTTIYAVVTVAGCASFPVPVSLTVNNCNVMPPILSCDVAGTQTTCPVCEDGATPGEEVDVYINFQSYPPEGYDIEITYGGSQSGFQTITIQDYAGGPLPFTITETTIFYLSNVICPNGCSDQTNLGNQLVFTYNLAPGIDDPGPLTNCGSVILPPITGTSLPADVAYFSQMGGMGTEYAAGDTIYTSTTLYIWANNNGCTAELPVTVNIDSDLDPGWTPPAGLCINDGPVTLMPDSTLGGTWTGTGVTDNGDGTAIFDPSIPGADSVTYAVGSPPCDTALMQVIPVFLTDTTNVNLTTCDPAAAGIDTSFLLNQNGCDSVVIATTSLLPADTTMLSAGSCDPAQIGTDTVFLMNQAGCDSLIITTTTLLPGDTTVLSDQSCDPAQVGMDTVFLMNQFGCDSLVITNTTLATADTLYILQTSCNPLDTGTVVNTIPGPLCDTVQIITTALLPSDTTFLSEGTCDPAEVGTDTVFLNNEFGCDSLIITTTNLLPNDTTFLAAESCDPAQVGADTVFLINQAGCDSLIITATSLLPSDTTFLTAESCDPAQVGMDTLFLNNQFGCDSLVITTTNLVTADTLYILQTSCNPLDTGTVVNTIPGPLCDTVQIITTALFPSDTTFLTEGTCDPAEVGTDTLFLDNLFGCDSLVITTTNLLPNDTTFLTAESCDPSQIGTDTVFLINQAGCDSLIITTTSLLPSDTTFLTAESCDPAQVGMDTVFLNNQFGCDSLIITTTSLLPSDTTFLTEVACDPAQAGTDTLFLNNQFGCDSLVITTTNLLPSDTTFVTEVNCDPAQVGTDTLFFNNQFDCDSIVILTTNLLPSDTTFITEENCDPAQVGTDTLFFNNQFGCDSLVITTINLLPSDTTFLTEETCDPAQVGMDTVFLNNQFDCDSLVITTTTLIPPVFTDINATVCFSDSISINGTFYSAANPTGTDTLQAFTGCDSILLISVTELPPPQQESIVLDLCPGETIEVNGTVYDEDNPTGTEVIESLLTGCDSVIVDIALNYQELELSISQINPTCLDPTGSIILENVSGAPGPYSFGLNNDPLIPVGAFPQTVEALDAGTYLVQVETADGCMAEQFVTLPAAPELFINLGEDRTIELGEVVQLNPVTNFEIASLLWEPAELLPCDTCLNLNFAPSSSLLVAVVGTNELGCTAMDEVFIEVLNLKNIYIPNAFTPDFDGINDEFTLYANAGLVDQINTLQVFSRWGEKLFENNNFQPNDPLEGWDGTFKGERLDPGVYVFYAEVVFIDGVTEVYEGSVTLIR